MNIALDSSRSKDQDGMLHVDISNVSKANVSPYLGKEIPRWKELGLDPEKVYYLYRDAQELEKAADTFNNKPILRDHTPVDVENPPKAAIVGYMGGDASFDGTYLKNSLHFHDASMIRDIESGEQRELSPGYRYRADMTPGEINGERYDGVMRDIACNHLAVVTKGRTGPDVLVNDHLPQEIAMSEKLKKRLEALKPFLAQDADMDEVKKVITQDDDDDEEAKKKAAAEKQAADEEKAAAEKKAADEAEAEKSKTDAGKQAADESDKVGPAKIAADAESKVIARFNALRKAENAVRPIVGELYGLDSADDVYRSALKHMGVDSAENLSGAPLEILFAEISKNHNKPQQPSMAHDSSLLGSLGDIIPNLKGRN